MTISLALADLSARDRYKILCATIVPRPIALVTSLGPTGVVNAAPFSFFNVFSEDPATVVLGLQHKPDPDSPTGHALKDTTRNIATSGLFVVNLVDEALAEAMNVCAVDFPPGTSEVEMAGLTPVPGTDIPVPHIKEAPFAYECRRVTSLVFGPDREILVGEVLRLHAREGLLDTDRMRIDDQGYRPVGRLYGNGYARQNDRFELTRETVDEYEARRRKA